MTEWIKNKINSLEREILELQQSNLPYYVKKRLIDSIRDDIDSYRGQR
jgi:hypothetical protein